MKYKGCLALIFALILALSPALARAEDYLAADHILITTLDVAAEDTAGLQACADRAEEAMALLRDSEDPAADFAQVAETYSDEDRTDYPDGYTFAPGDGVMPEDFVAAVRELERLQGGFACAADGEVKASVALPLGGLMSPLPAGEVMTQMETANAAVRSLGCQMAAPFMTLSFISLPTVPDLGLTDVGLIDVLAHTTCPLILENED